MLALNKQRYESGRGNFILHPEPEQRQHYWRLYTLRKIARVERVILEVETFIVKARSVIMDYERGGS